MATFRVFKESGEFVIVHKAFIHDASIGWKAKGILLYLLSRPNDWKIYETELIKHTSDGLSSLKSGIKQLEKAGYIKRVRKRDDKGRMQGYDYEVYEQPNHMRKSNVVNENDNSIHMRKSNVGKSNNGKTNVGKSDDGKSHATNNNSTKNKGTYIDSTKNDGSSGTSATQPPPLPSDKSEDAFEFYQQNGFGMLQPTIVEQIKAWIDDFEGNEDIVVEALKEAATNNVYKWAYVNSILKNWYQSGVKSVEDIKARKKAREKQSNQSESNYDNAQYKSLF
ncbi:phi ETA orf 22-like protein [Staphylococcus petrasii]|uniref:DnaD domain protein n=1 Tax=Staphylococcus petrasii TaxID=1276936 RepID=A0A380G0I1_9STAP|nr:DnaD domain protein [Staphylococcus petrasii]PNZ31293.1 DNA replication protein DnaD [Staphylococcus petrasii]TGE11715.1 DnaD domain protein [Staphylococcus petrasii]TGE15103.1 DnaD domain protein [Staphylococcus petrasii]SUM44634.1 phi ETA orf 22-like protein [Staphylococcus petrasii]